VSTWRRTWAAATTGGAPQKALIVALVIGTILNLINQGDVLWGHAAVQWGKLGLTYLTPFLVSLHGQTTAKMALNRS